MRPLVFLLFPLLFTSCGPKVPMVFPALETDPVSSRDDAADDPAIFIHPTDPTRNAIIGTNKQKGLMVFDAHGKIVHEYTFGEINNVDLRQEIDWNGSRITLVGGSNRSDNSIVFYRLNEETLELTPLHDAPIPSAVDEVYGFCLYRNAGIYAFVVGKNGVVEQWELRPAADNRLTAMMVRTFDVGGQCEGMVADDEQGNLYISEETVAIWKYGANPEDDATRTAVQTIKGNKNLKADLEGLALYPTDNGNGYLLASSQGNNTYAVFERNGNNAYLGSFKIKKLNGIDGASETDGIEITNKPFNSQFPGGVLVVQDGRNGRENQNFKLVDWTSIEKAVIRTQQ